MTEIVKFPGTTKADLPPNRALEAAIEHDLEAAIIIGETKDGELYFAASLADAARVCFLLRLAERQLLALAEEELAT